jgi:MFS family permease
MANVAALPRFATHHAYRIAWGAALVFYFFEYVARSAPAVMIPELSSAYAVDAVGISAILGAYYYTYSITSLLAGAALDRFGARFPVALGAALLGVGCLIFILPVSASGFAGRLLQGAGSAFAFTGAVFLATHGFSGRVLATAVGFTQCFGMLGGSAGQIAVGPLVHGLLDWRGFWVALGLACFAVAAILFVSTPTEPAAPTEPRSFLAPFKIVFSNPQSYLCGLVAGLLFAPTTIGDMTWGVALLQQDRDYGYLQAVGIAAMCPLGWAVGCPLLGSLADLVGRRTVVLIGGMAVMLAAVLVTGYSGNATVAYIGAFVLGVGSGAAMIPYTIIKEANPDQVKGSATGVINFITFSVTAAIGPAFAMLIGKTLASTDDHEAHFQHAAWFWAAAIVLAILVSLMLRETGSRATRKAPQGEMSPSGVGF